MCKIITVANQKGGVGKTTICQHLSYIMAEQGRRVLCVDFDPQTNLSASLLSERQLPKENIHNLMLCLLEDCELPNIEGHIQHCGKVDLLPGSKDLARLEVSVLHRAVLTENPLPAPRQLRLHHHRHQPGGQSAHDQRTHSGGQCAHSSLPGVLFHRGSRGPHPERSEKQAPTQPGYHL